MLTLLVVVGGTLATTQAPISAVSTVRSATVSQGDPSANLSIGIAPGSWTMAAGSRATFTAAAIGVPTGCSVDSLSVRWILPDISGYDGYLNTSSGTSVTFTTFPGSQGSATLEAVGSGIATCGGTPYAIAPSGSAQIVILPLLALRDLVVAPNPAGLSSVVAFGAAVQGGLAPYDTTLDFGDGSRGSLTLSSAGEAIFHHHYPVGRYTAQWTVVDGLGDRASLAAPEPVVVTTAIGAAIIGGAPSVDVGASETLDVNVTGGLAPYFVQWSASNGQTYFATPWKITFSTAGQMLVQATITDSTGSTTSASLAVQVVTPPSLGVSQDYPGGDVGRPLPFAVNLSGGVGPFTLVWSIVGEGGNASAQLPTDGRYVEPVVPSLPGPLWVEASVQDAFGKRSQAGGPVAEIYPTPRLVLAAATPLAESGVPLRISGFVTGGAPPIQWVLSASLATNDSTNNSGTFSGPNTLHWTAVPIVPGNLTTVVTATDGVGVTVVASTSVTVIPGVTARLVLASSPIQFASGTLSADVEGGRPPYAYMLSLTDGEVFSGNLSVSGPYAWTVSPRVAGFLGVHLEVVDSLGARTGFALTAVVSAGTPNPPPTTPTPGTPTNSSASSWWLGLLGLAGIAAVLVLPKRLRRKRGGADPASPATAMRAVREYLRESDGLDRGTLYFLAEDDGLSEASAADAIRRWTRAGRITAELGPEDEEVLRWTEQGRAREAATNREEASEE